MKESRKNSGMTQEVDAVEIEIENPDILSTKELLKAQRKKNYAAYKDARRQARAEEKEQVRKEREKLRSEKDKALKELLFSGNKLEELQKITPDKS